MNERSPSSGGETAPDPRAILGVTIEELETILAEAGHYNFFLDQVFSDRQDYEEHKAGAIQRIDAVFTVLGLRQPEMVDKLIDSSEVYSRHGGDSVTHEELQGALQQGATCGQVLYSRTFWALDIEGDESDLVSREMWFRLAGGRELGFEATGEFWTDRTYIHPVTGEDLDQDERDIAEIEEELGRELEIKYSKIVFHLDFKGWIIAPNKGTFKLLAQ